MQESAQHAGAWDRTRSLRGAWEPGVAPEACGAPGLGARGRNGSLRGTWLGARGSTGSPRGTWEPGPSAVTEITTEAEVGSLCRRAESGTMTFQKEKGTASLQPICFKPALVETPHRFLSRDWGEHNQRFILPN